MASTTYCAETHQLVIQSIASMDPQWRADLRDALQAEGVVLSKKKTSPKRPPAQSSEAKHSRPFDPSVCQARRIEEMCHPGTKNLIFRKPNKATHLGCIDFQCRQKILADGLCSDCLNSKKRVCDELGKTPFGLFDQPRPAQPSRVSKTDQRKHTYVWMEDTQDNEEYMDYLTDPNSNPRNSKKSSSSSDEGADIDWSKVVQNENWSKKFKVPALREILAHHNQDTSGKKPDLVDRVAAFFMPYDDDEQQSDEAMPSPRPDGHAAVDEGLREAELAEQAHAAQEAEHAEEAHEAEHADHAEEQVVQEHLLVDVEPENHGEIDAAAANSDDDDDDDDDDSEDEDDQERPITIQDVEYVIKNGSIYDIKTNREMADDEDTDPSKWNRKSRQVHKTNVEAIMSPR